MTHPDGGAAASSRTLELGGRTVTVERVSGRKAQVAFTLIRQAGVALKAVSDARAAFIREYEAANTVSLTRAQARVRFPPRPIIDEDLGIPLREGPTIPNPRAGDEGEPDTITNPRAGELVIAPSPVDAIDAEDWQASGDRLELPRSPDKTDLMMALMPEALEHGEETVYRLLALFSMSNADVKHARRNGDGIIAELDRRAEELLDDALLDELVELAVIATEVVDEQFRRKAESIGGGRLGNALRSMGLDLPSSTSPSSTSDSSTDPSSSEQSTEERPASSSDGAERSQDGDPTTSSSSPTESSSSSASS